MHGCNETKHLDILSHTMCARNECDNKTKIKKTNTTRVFTCSPNVSRHCWVSCVSCWCTLDLGFHVVTHPQFHVQIIFLVSCHRQLNLYPKFLHISRETGSFEVLSAQWGVWAFGEQRASHKSWPQLLRQLPLFRNDWNFLPGVFPRQQALGLGDQWLGRALSSPLLPQEREEPAGRRQTNHSMEKFCWQLNHFSHTQVRGNLYTDLVRFVKQKSGRDMGKRKNQDCTWKTEKSKFSLTLESRFRNTNFKPILAGEVFNNWMELSISSEKKKIVLLLAMNNFEEINKNFVQNLDLRQTASHSVKNLEKVEQRLLTWNRKRSKSKFRRMKWRMNEEGRKVEIEERSNTLAHDTWMGWRTKIERMFFDRFLQNAHKHKKRWRVTYSLHLEEEHEDNNKSCIVSEKKKQQLHVVPPIKIFINVIVNLGQDFKYTLHFPIFPFPCSLTTFCVFCAKLQPPMSTCTFVVSVKKDGDRFTASWNPFPMFGFNRVDAENHNMLHCTTPGMQISGPFLVHYFFFLLCILVGFLQQPRRAIIRIFFRAKSRRWLSGCIFRRRTIVNLSLPKRLKWRNNCSNSYVLRVDVPFFQSCHM